MVKDKIILITGASRGIGRSVAKYLAIHGAQTILLSRTIADLQTLSQDIVRKKNLEPALYPFNLCSATLEDYDDLRRNISAKFGRLDGLIHCAGILGALSPIEHFNIQTWYQVLQVNLNAAFILTQATMPLLKQTARASIIFTIADVATTPKANWGAYAVANSGCATMVKMLAEECANTSNIRVNAIQASKVRTALRAAAYPAEAQAELINPDALAPHYAYLMQGDNHVNGQIIQVNNGHNVESQSSDPQYQDQTALHAG